MFFTKIFAVGFCITLAINLVRVGLRTFTDFKNCLSFLSFKNCFFRFKCTFKANFSVGNFIEFVVKLMLF